MKEGRSSVGLRLACVQLFDRLLHGGGSLTRLLPEFQAAVAEREQSQLQAWCFGFARHFGELSGLVDALLDKPLKTKDQDVYLLMLLGIFQLRHTPVSAHAAVDETVKVVRQLRKPWARGLVNAVLRNYQRRESALLGELSDSARFSHPHWLLSRLQADWPDCWQDLCISANQQAPLVLRVNQQRGSRQQYLARLRDARLSAEAVPGTEQAVILRQPVPVQQLPGFADGDVSVQDAAAQLATHYLTTLCVPGSRLLDACSAPGGKTAHALETGHFASVLALDQDPRRLDRVAATLSRLHLEEKASLQAVDASELSAWWDGRPFQAVLLDAPCSGTGVIRRHPDIKLLRRDSDIQPLVDLQARLLDALWQTLEPGGLLHYATCSILKCENEQQVAAFLARTGDAEPAADMRQIFPGENDMDGFFHAPIRKRTAGR